MLGSRPTSRIIRGCSAEHDQRVLAEADRLVRMPFPTRRTRRTDRPVRRRSADCLSEGGLHDGATLTAEPTCRSSAESCCGKPPTSSRSHSRADWTYEDQTALPLHRARHVQRQPGRSSTFSSLYNLCISNNAASLPGAIQARPAGRQPFVQPANSFFVEHVQPAPGACSRDIDRRRAVARSRVRRRASWSVQRGERCGRTAVPWLQFAAAVVGRRGGEHRQHRYHLRERAGLCAQ